jgi:hypothetical protein
MPLTVEQVSTAVQAARIAMQGHGVQPTVPLARRHAFFAILALILQLLPPHHLKVANCAMQGHGLMLSENQPSLRALFAMRELGLP